MDSDDYLSHADGARVNSAQNLTYAPPVERLKDRIVRETVELLLDEELKLLNDKQRRLLVVRYELRMHSKSPIWHRPEGTRNSGSWRLESRSYDPEI
jgi:hypothetical protein